MSPLQGFRMMRGTIRRLRCATPPVIHNAAASAAILLSQNKNSTEILHLSLLVTNIKTSKKISSLEKQIFH
jgi:hypothetical protein